MDRPASERPPGHSALRKGRVSIPGQPYVVTIVTKNRQFVFADFDVGRLVVATMRKLHERGAIESLAFVVMPDHLHWLFVLGETTGLPEVVRRLKGSSAHAIRRRGVSSVWQTGYYDHGVRDGEDLRTAARYLVANPLRAGLVDDLRDYPLWDAVWLDSALER